MARNKQEEADRIKISQFWLELAKIFNRAKLSRCDESISEYR